MRIRVRWLLLRCRRTSGGPQVGWHLGPPCTPAEPPARSASQLPRVPAHTLQSLKNNLEKGDWPHNHDEKGKKVLGRHMYRSRYENTTLFAADMAAIAATTGIISTYLGERLHLIKSDNGDVQILNLYNSESINIVTADIQASNGVIHIIDQVIIYTRRWGP